MATYSVTRPENFKKIGDALNSIGWFVPPYVSVGLLDMVADEITQTHGQFTEDRVEQILSLIYSPDRLASMVVGRYPHIPVVDLYQETIAEAVAAHFSGLRHVAVSGLMPVVEGIGRGLALQRGLKHGSYVKRVFQDLFTEAKQDAWRRKIGATQEIEDMLDAFFRFLDVYFFENSVSYPLRDKTNRNGILHGAYKDADYGRPINFFKTISAIDILTFVSTLQMAKMPKFAGFLPDDTAESKKLAKRYRQLETGLKCPSP
jgi:hypothetical protein